MKPVLTIDEHGTALIEAAVAIILVASLITAILTFMYISFARVWIGRNCYEAAVCLSTSAGEFVCKKKLRAAVTRMLPFGSISSLSAARDSKAARVSIDYLIGDRLRIHRGESLVLPLADRGTK